MNDPWTPPNPYTLDWHAEQCERYAKGLPIEGRTDEPITGMYRVRMFKNGVFVPFYYFYAPYADTDERKLFCEVDCDKIYTDLELLDNKQTIIEAWEFAAKEPIKGEVYEFYRANHRWPEISAAVHEASNNPPDDNSAEALEDNISTLIEEAERELAKGEAKTQEECNQASVLVGKLNEWFQYDGNREWLKKRTRMDARITLEVIEAHETYTKVGMSILNSVQRCGIFRRLKQERQKPFLVKLKRAAERVGETMPVQHAVLGYPATHLSTQKRAALKDDHALHVCLDFESSTIAQEARQKWANAYVRKYKKAPPGCEVVEEDVAS